MRAYSSLRQLEEKGICVDEYLTNERDGVFKARLDCKRWGKKRNILAYFTFEDRSKVMASAWQNTGYLGCLLYTSQSPRDVVRAGRAS